MIKCKNINKECFCDYISISIYLYILKMNFGLGTQKCFGGMVFREMKGTIRSGSCPCKTHVMISCEELIERWSTRVDSYVHAC